MNCDLGKDLNCLVVYFNGPVNGKNYIRAWITRRDFVACVRVVKKKI
jgi:hypothetical protein